MSDLNSFDEEEVAALAEKIFISLVPSCGDGVDEETAVDYAFQRAEDFVRVRKERMAAAAKNKPAPYAGPAPEVDWNEVGKALVK